MGMDVYGKKPTAPSGEYFRNNVWWWRPLANYILEVAPAPLTRKCHSWHSNDGAGLGAADARTLAVILQDELDSGRCQIYADAYEAKRKSIPPIMCEICQGSGVRSDSVGVENKQPTRRIEDPEHPRFGQIGWCNGCDGVGTRPSWDAAYPFSAENVREFVTFLRDCGGFSIC